MEFDLNIVLSKVYAGLLQQDETCFTMLVVNHQYIPSESVE
jgi:hypothetical protein